MWRILQQDKPEDFVLATGEMHYVREFVEKAFQVLGVKIGLVQFARMFNDAVLLNVAVGGLERASMRSGQTLKAAKSSCESIPSTSVRPKSSKYQGSFSLFYVEPNATCI